MVDVFLPSLLVRGEESLVGGIAHEVEAEDKGVALYLLEGGIVGGLELPLQDLEPVKTHAGGVFEIGVEGAQFLAAESPEGIRGNTDAVWSVVRAYCFGVLSFRAFWRFNGREGPEGSSRAAGGGKKVTTVHGKSVSAIGGKIQAGKWN